MKSNNSLSLLPLGLLGSLHRVVLAAGVVMAVSSASADERADVSALLLRYGSELNHSRTAEIVGLYTSDGVFMPAGAPTAVGSEQLRFSYGKVFEAIKLAVQFEIEEVEVHGDVAWARTISRGNVTILATGTTQLEENRELFVLRRVNGAWRIARYMFNQPRR